jgi:trk system potassium uptake protein
VYVVIMGCGRVGSALSAGLERLGHEVAVIDKDAQAFRRLGPDFRGKQVIGQGFHREVMIEAGVERAQAFAAVSSGDNSNIISARVARETFGIEHVVARIYDAKRAAVYERLGIPTVATVPWTIDHVLRRLVPQDHEGVTWTDPTARVVIIERTVPATFVGAPLSSIDAPGDSRLVSVGRLGAAIVPSPDLVAQDGDILHVAVGIDRVAAFDERLAGLTGKGH